MVVWCNVSGEPAGLCIIYSAPLLVNAYTRCFPIYVTRNGYRTHIWSKKLVGVKHHRITPNTRREWDEEWETRASILVLSIQQWGKIELAYVLDMCSIFRLWVVSSLLTPAPFLVDASSHFLSVALLSFFFRLSIALFRANASFSNFRFLFHLPFWKCVKNLHLPSL